MKMIKTEKKTEKINPKEVQQSYLQRMENKFTDKGVVFFDPTEGTLNITGEYLCLPLEITNIDSKELGEYLNAFTQQKMYLRTLHGRVELSIEESRRLYTEASNEAYIKLSSGKLSETAKERVVNSDEKIRPLYYKFIDLKKSNMILEYNISNIEDAIFLLSREISRRVGDFNEDYRNSSVQRR